MAVDTWTAHSRPQIQRLLAVAMAGVGLMLIWLQHRGGGEPAAQWLGVLLVVLGAGGLLTAGRQTITIDPATQTITVVTRSPLGERSRTIAFSDVTSITVQRVGRASSGTEFFSLSLSLRSGGSFPLFTPGRFFPGSMSRTTVESWRARLSELVTPRDLRPLS